VSEGSGVTVGMETVAVAVTVGSTVTAGPQAAKRTVRARNAKNSFFI
jgi:hypothetical protein